MRDDVIARDVGGVEREVCATRVDWIFPALRFYQAIVELSLLGLAEGLQVHAALYIAKSCDGAIHP